MADEMVRALPIDRGWHTRSDECRHEGHQKPVLICCVSRVQSRVVLDCEMLNLLTRIQVCASVKLLTARSSGERGELMQAAIWTRIMPYADDGDAPHQQRPQRSDPAGPHGAHTAGGRGLLSQQ